MFGFLIGVVVTVYVIASASRRYLREREVEQRFANVIADLANLKTEVDTLKQQVEMLKLRPLPQITPSKWYDPD
jgi:hypothetical protein